MAVTKMHPIRRTVGKAVDYITDKDKTDGEIYVSTYGCTRETVEDDFDYTRHKASYNGAMCWCVSFKNIFSCTYGQRLSSVPPEVPGSVCPLSFLL